MNEFLTQQRNTLFFYTDGSKSEASKSVGSASVCPSLEILTSRSINSKASIFTAECIAIHDALAIAVDNKCKNVNIFSDSLSSLKSIENFQDRSKTNSLIFKIRQKLNDCHENNLYDTGVKLF